MRDLNYELAPKPGMPASQRKAELDAARFVAVRNLAYMIYKKPDGAALMTYQETLDNREMVKQAIINSEIAEGLLQNDLGMTVAPQSQAPQMIPQNGAQMAQQPPQMSFPMQPAPQAPMSPAQFAQMPMQPQAGVPFQPTQPGQPQFVPQQQFAQPPQQTYAAPQMQPQQGFAPQQMAAPAAPPMEAAPVTGKKRKAAAGNAVAPPPTGPALAPPGFVPQQGQVPVTQFQQPPAPQQQGFPVQFQQQPQFAQPQFQQPQAVNAPQAQMPQQGGPDLGALFQKLDMLGKGIEVSANNGDQALKAVAKLQADVDEVKLLGNQLLVCLHHLYLGIQTASGQPLLSNMTEGKANTLADFRTYLQKYIGPPK